MHYFHRKITPPKGSYFLLGPRGTGKSTWLKHHYPEAERIDLLLGDEERQLSAYPERIRKIVDRMEPGSTLILDEIQRVPRLLPEIHALIEEKREIQYIMTGSSTRKLRRSVSDLLGGRALLRQMGPFLASELGNEFSLEKALKIGLIPLIWTSPNPEERIRNYIHLYLREEVQSEGLVRQIGDFSRFLEIASFSYGSIWTSTDIGRESSVKRATVDNYLQILEDLFLAFSIPVFSRRAKRKVIAHPKFYFFDLGVFHALRPRGILDSMSEIYPNHLKNWDLGLAKAPGFDLSKSGPYYNMDQILKVESRELWLKSKTNFSSGLGIDGNALEGLVAQHLRTWVLSQTEPHSLSFWRTQTKLEVDFIVYGPRGFWAIEVKLSPNLGPDDIRGMAAFKEEYPEATCFFVAPIKRHESYRGFNILPLEDFLRSITPENPIQ